MTDQTEKEAINLLNQKAQEDLNKHEIVNYFQTDVLNGRHVSVIQMKGGSIFIKQTSHHVPDVEPYKLHLSPETFSFLLEAFLHAEKEFGIDRKKNLSALTEDSKILFKKTLSLNGI